MLGIRRRPADEGREHQVVALGHFGGAEVRLAVAGPVPVVEKGGHLVVLFPGLGHGELVSGLLLEFLLVVRVVENVLAILQVMPVAVDRILDHLVAPGRHAAVVECHVLHAGGIEVGLGNRRKVVVEIADPVRTVEQHVVGALPGLERDHDALEQIPERHVHDVDLGARQLFELLGVEGGRLAHHRHRVGDDAQGAALVGLLRDRVVRTESGYIFFYAVFLEVLCRGRRAAQGERDRGCEQRVLDRMHDAYLLPVLSNLSDVIAWGIRE